MANRATLLDLKSVDPVEWCENNIQLDYGPFDRARHPLLVEPLRAAGSMLGGYVGLIGSVQHIKTLIAQLWHAWGMVNHPARSAIYDLTGDALDAFSEDKFTPLIDRTDALLRLIPDEKRRKLKYYIGMPYGHVRLLSVGKMANRNSKTLERISADESWDYEDGHLKQLHDRQASFTWSWQFYLPSSGQTKDSELDDLWKRSTQKVWHVPCDCCGELIPYIWTPEPVDGEIPMGGIRFKSGDEVMRPDGSVDWDTLKSSVYYECQKCGGRMEWDASKVEARNLKGCYVQMNPNGDPKIDFYHYNAMAHFPWPDLAEEFKQASLERSRGSLKGLENFVRKRLAGVWDENKYVATGEPPKARGGYKVGEPWEPVPGVDEYVFATVDVQQDHFYLVIRAWRLVAGRLESRQLERRKLLTDLQIKELCDKWKIPQGGLNSSVGCRVFCDGNYNADQVKRMCALHGWMVLRGDEAKDFLHPDKIRRIYAPRQNIDAFEGTGNGAKYVGQFYFSNNEASNRLALIRSIRDPDPIWTYADGTDVEVYEKQLNGYVRIQKTHAATGRPYYVWIKRGDEHYHSCEKMQVVCAAMADLVGASSAVDSAPSDEGGAQ